MTQGRPASAQPSRRLGCAARPGAARAAVGAPCRNPRSSICSAATCRRPSCALNIMNQDEFGRFLYTRHTIYYRNHNGQGPGRARAFATSCRPYNPCQQIDSQNGAPAESAPYYLDSKISLIGTVVIEQDWMALVASSNPTPAIDAPGTAEPS